MNITIVGAGNIGTQFAVHCAEKYNNVIVYGSQPKKVSNDLFVVDENGNVIHTGKIDCATDNEEKAFQNAELIFVTMPAFCMKDIAEKIYPFANKNMKICIVPGTGGGECSFKKCVEKGATVFGLQRVPSVARLKEYGKTVCATGYREELFVAAIPKSETENCCKIIGDIFDGMKCSPMPAYLNLTLTPSNPILHTTRLRVLFKDYKPGKVYKSIPLFYEDWTDETSELIFKCDDEVQAICKALDMFDLSFVKSLRTHYESYTCEAFTNKIRGIKGFKGITSPSVSADGGLVPDMNSRYFTADFPFGLSILIQISDLLGLDAENMKATMQWYKNLSGEITEFSFANYGINNLEEFIRFYQR